MKDLTMANFLNSEKLDLSFDNLTLLNNERIEAYKNLKNIGIPSKRNERWKYTCLLYTSPSPRDYAASRMPSSA